MQARPIRAIYWKEAAMSDQETMFVTVRMPTELVKQIDALAVEAMRSRTAQVIVLLRQALESEAANVKGS
jgi:predicted transcriptional regulator